MPEIVVDQHVVEYINQSGQDYRICTSCSGPIMLPVALKSPKTSDIVLTIGGNRLFISRVQARYIRKVTLDMIYDPQVGLSCNHYPDL